MPIEVTHIKPEFSDKRGFISRLVDDDTIKFRAVLYIASKKGAVRANHYHKKDSHSVYCLSGRFKYIEKDMRKPSSKIESVILKPGDLVLTRPMVAHRMEFLEDSVFLAITTEPRDQGRYEEDTVRLRF
jgi:dTDP-4-dehydrorhamnose 3,5-epimerase-like enzyme